MLYLVKITRINYIIMQKKVEGNRLRTKTQNLKTEENQDTSINAYQKATQVTKKKVPVSPIPSKTHKFLPSYSSTKQINKEKGQNKLNINRRLSFRKTEISVGQETFPEEKAQVKMGINKQNKDQLAPTVPILNRRHQQSKSLVTQQPKANQKKPEVAKIKPNRTISTPKNKTMIPSKAKKPVVVDPMVQELILRNIDVSFKDIVGLYQAKSILQEAVIRPRQRPDLYTGIRAPPRALLLYGPPGNGKTFLCKALAHESKCTFIALSASSIVNKFLGQSEKTLKKIFLEAQKLAPAIIFIDEIDSMLTARSEKEHEASRRLKNEFFVQLDGISSSKSGQVLFIGATNLPKELDSAAKRRFSKLVYVGNPDQRARKQILLKYLKGVQFDLTPQDINRIVQGSQYFSASEIQNIVTETSMFPLREVRTSKLKGVTIQQIRKVNVKDFMFVISQRKPIVSKEQLEQYKEKV